VETVFAIITLTEHQHSLETLPFINPLLWLNWTTILSLVLPLSPVLGILAGLFGVIQYGMCFWLTIGYGTLGYGVHQYMFSTYHPYAAA
jgi:hypothetical protein